VWLFVELLVPVVSASERFRRRGCRGSVVRCGCSVPDKDDDDEAEDGEGQGPESCALGLLYESPVLPLELLLEG
jgi:hypothetical protein